MDPKVFSREFVKPLNNDHPKIHNLSFFDQMILFNYYVPLLFFYKTTQTIREIDIQKSSRVLKTSLSAALSRYYPLAGRIKDDITVDCNDEGALFLEAKMERDVSEILESPDDEILKPLFPDSLYYKDSTLTGPVAVQVTYFRCGGMSIGLCLCHKILDMESMTSFVKDWASLARMSEVKIISPEFNIGSLYPPFDELRIPKQKQADQEAPPPPEMKEGVSRRFVFDGAKIEKLKHIVADQVPNPTRVEVVASLLYKSAISANAKATGSDLNSSFMNHAMNLRARVSDPPVTERNIGNLSGNFPVVSGREVELGLLVKEFRKAKTEFSNSCANSKHNEEGDLYPLIMKEIKPLSEYLNSEHQIYGCTSWCRYPFYETDFGWGKPLWVTTLLYKPLKNLITLIDTKEGNGIEAYICLDEKSMDVFENDQDLLLFSRLNPSVLTRT